jgi:hypothetical protein
MRKNQAAGSRLTDTEVGTSRRKRIVPRAMPDEMDKPPRKRGKSTGRGGRGRGRVLRGGGLGSRVFPGDDGEYNEFADEQDEPYHSSDEEDDSVQQQQCAPRTKPATAAKPPKPSHVSNIDGKDSGLQDIGYVTKKQLAAGLLSVERPSTSAMNKTSYSNHPQSSATITMSDPLPPPVTHSHQQLPVTQHQQEPKFTWNAMQQPSGRDKAVASGSLSEDVLSSHFSGFQDSPNQPNLRQVNEKEYIETARFNEIIDLSSVMTSVGLVTNGKDDAFVAMPAYQSQTNSPGDVETGADVGFSTPIRSATNFTGNGMVGGMGANGSGSPFLEGSQRSGVSVSAGFNNFASLSRNISGPQSTGGDHYYGVTQLITNPVTGVKHTTFPSLRYEHGVVQEEPLPQGRPSRSLSRSSSGSCVAETVDCHSPSVLTPLTSPSLLRAKQVALPRARTESPPDSKLTVFCCHISPVIKKSS